MNTLKMANSNSRYAWADLIRVVAIYGVVLIHSCGEYFYQFEDISRSSWLQSVLLDSIVRSAVPLFVMLSGALILCKSEKCDDALMEVNHLPRRLTRILIPLLVWSGVYFWHLARNGVPVNVRSIFISPAMYHLWFAYMIVGIYFILPVIRPIFTAMTRSVRLSAYFFLIWFVVTSLPVYLPIPLLSLLMQSSLFGYGGYFILGAMIAQANRIPFSTLSWLLVFFASIGVTVLVTWIFSKQAGSPVETAFKYFSPNTVVASVAAFVLLSRVSVSGRLVSWLHYCSDRTFFIYFVHVLTLEYVRFNPGFLGMTGDWPVGLKIVAISLLTFAISLAIAALVNLIPRSRHVFG